MPENKSTFIISLEKELEKHWEDTKEERIRTHTTKLYRNINLKKEV